MGNDAEKLENCGWGGFYEKPWSVIRLCGDDAMNQNVLTLTTSRLEWVEPGFSNISALGIIAVQLKRTNLLKNVFDEFLHLSIYKCLHL